MHDAQHLPGPLIQFIAVSTLNDDIERHMQALIPLDELILHREDLLLLSLGLGRRGVLQEEFFDVEKTFGLLLGRKTKVNGDPVRKQ